MDALPQSVPQPPNESAPYSETPNSAGLTTVEDAEPAQAAGGHSTTIRHHPPRLLLVEDDSNDVGFILRRLEKDCPDVVCRHARAMEDVLRLLREFQPDVVVSDFCLRGFTGLDVLEALERAGSTAPFILMSGAISESEAVRYLHRGATDFVNKSCLERLPWAVEKALQQRAAAQQQTFDQIELRKLRESYEATQGRCNKLAQNLRTANQDHAKRLAREIHDELGQQLTGIRLGLAALGKKPSEPLNTLSEMGLASLTARVEQLAATIQTFTSDLHGCGSEDPGLAARLEGHARSLGATTGLEMSFESRLDAGQVIGEEQTHPLFRICQESLTNVLRHAGATAVQIRLSVVKDGLCLTVRDNGRGISGTGRRRPGSRGLSFMEERARELGGSLNVQPNQDGPGTLVCAVLPVC